MAVPVDQVDRPPPEVRIIDLGVRPYREVLELQRHYAQERQTGRIDHDVLLLVEHEPVVTLGRGSDRTNLLVTEDWLRDRGVDVVQIERGGDVTYHGPGQLVGYPILDLHHYRLDLHWYLRRLEEVLLSVLVECGLTAFRVENYTGVWTGEVEGAPGMVAGVDSSIDADDDGFPTVPSTRSPELIGAGRIRKVGSIGVHASRWVTRHGFALNVTEEPLAHFPWIVPCGIGGVEMSSLAREGVTRSMTQARDAVLRGFDAAFAPVRLAHQFEPSDEPRAVP